MISPSDATRRLTTAGALLAGTSAAVTVFNAITLPRLAAPCRSSPEHIVVCVPARDEVSRLPELIDDLRAQTHCPQLRVVVLDDGSTDGTFRAAEHAVDGDARFRVLRSENEPPPGWTGKAAACRILADSAFEGDVDCIVFVDADVRLHPGAVAAAVAALRSRGAALVCPWPEQISGTVVEALVQPLLSFSWMSSLPMRSADVSTRPSMVVACGQFMVFDADAYLSIGGHASVAASPTEDLDIARALRRRGERTSVVAGGEFVRCRMYEGWPDLREGYTRWLWNAFGGRVGSAAVLASVSVMYVVPPIAALVGSGATRRWGTAGYVAAVAARVVAARTEASSAPETSVRSGWRGRSLAAAAAHPLSVIVYGALTAESFRRRRRRSTTWKGRALPAHARPGR